METSIDKRPALTASWGSLKNLPVNLFGAVMGLAGLSLAWRVASTVFGAGTMIADAAGMTAIVVFIALALGYGAKWAKYPSAVKDEFTHPIAGNFFGTITIGILLLSTVVATYSTLLQEIVWAIGTILTIALTFISLTRLLKGNMDVAHATPSLLISGVATLDIAVAGGTLPMAWAHEVNLFAASAGAVVAIVFFTMIFSRLVHQAPLASGMMPSMMILIAPFEVGFLAYVNVVHRIDAFAALLFYVGLFFFAILATRIFRRSIAFATAWWAISFPMAALSNAALKYAAARQTIVLEYLAGALLAIVTIAIVVLFVRTLRILVNGKLLGG
ncbi:SLAC1 anion channel family protein [Massilia sp.]|uniref:SLAC1 anion channel family protein n=1 Tax=Massilia sp. TaxID=1882437 RepID=UPI00352C93B0